MKLSLKVLAAGITALLILSSCVSAPENDTSETITQNETEPIKTKKIEEKKPEDPPEVAFAKKLQAKLENRDIQ